MKKLIVVACVVMVGLGVEACALPAIDQIDLSGCTDKCNADSVVCFDTVNKKADDCLNLDGGQFYREKCLQEQTKQGEKCINVLVACVSDCIEATEKQLGKK